MSGSGLQIGRIPKHSMSAKCYGDGRWRERISTKFKKQYPSKVVEREVQFPRADENLEKQIRAFLKGKVLNAYYIKEDLPSPKGAEEEAVFETQAGRPVTAAGEGVLQPRAARRADLPARERSARGDPRGTSDARRGEGGGYRRGREEARVRVFAVASATAGDDGWLCDFRGCFAEVGQRAGALLAEGDAAGKPENEEAHGGRHGSGPRDQTPGRRTGGFWELDCDGLQAGVEAGGAADRLCRS